MGDHLDRGALALQAFGRGHTLVRRDLGADAVLSKRGMTFRTEAWRVGDVGHLCIMRMRAFFGLMRMETFIFAPTAVDAPLFNVDWVSAFGTETQIAEFYDVQLEPWSQEHHAKLQAVSDGIADLPDMQSEPHWYDDLLYPFSSAKRGKGMGPRLEQAARDYTAAYVAQLHLSPTCDPAQKREKVRAFAERLYSQGGAAVQQVTKLFGSETARRLVVRCMYGVEDS
jgi:hypothetical protein